MTVDVPSTFGRYPGVMITTTPFKEVDDPSIQHVYDLPVTSRLGRWTPRGPAPSRPSCSPAGILRPAWLRPAIAAAGRRRPVQEANTKGRHALGEQRPALAAGAGAGNVAGEDRPVQIDIYASTDKIFLFRTTGLRAARLPAGRMPAGPVTR
jgi:hypothetical protein